MTGWESREVQHGSIAKQYIRNSHWRSSNVKAAAAREVAKLGASQLMARNCTSSPSALPAPSPPSAGAPGRRRLTHWRLKSGYENHMACACTKAGKGKKVTCRGHDGLKAPSSTQKLLNKLSRAEEAARGF